MSDIEYSDNENTNNNEKQIQYEDLIENPTNLQRHYYEKIRSIVSDYYLSLGSKPELPTNYGRLFAKKYKNNYLTDVESHYDDVVKSKFTHLYQIIYDSEVEGQVNLYVNGKKSGYFRIDKYNYMEIFIYRPYRGLGLARMMIRELLNQLDNPEKNDLFYVDLDSTDGFWDHYGCIRECGSDDIKKITYQQLNSLV